MLITGKWNESLSCQPCETEGEPLPGDHAHWRTATRLERAHLEGLFPSVGASLPWLFVSACSPLKPFLTW